MRRYFFIVVTLIACIPVFGFYRWGMQFILEPTHAWLVSAFAIFAVCLSTFTLVYMRQRIDRFLTESPPMI